MKSHLQSYPCARDDEGEEETQDGATNRHAIPRYESFGGSSCCLPLSLSSDRSRERKSSSCHLSFLDEIRKESCDKRLVISFLSPIGEREKKRRFVDHLSFSFLGPPVLSSVVSSHHWARSRGKKQDRREQMDRGRLANSLSCDLDLGLMRHHL